MKMMAILMTMAATACYVEPEPNLGESDQQIGGPPQSTICYATDPASCSTPTCRDPDCVAQQYFCCDYGDIAQPIGCYFAIDITTCSI